MRLVMAAACVGGVIALAARPLAGSEDDPSPPQPAWAPWTRSPVPMDTTTLSPFERDALRRCGEGEAGLGEVAQAIVARKLRGLPIPDLDGLALAQRSAGEPHPWPRAWVAGGRPLDTEATSRKLDAWLATGAAQRTPWRRCGVASGSTADGSSAVALVSVEALADLAPLPTHARAGQWLAIEARLRVPASGGQVVVLGPSGAPRALLTSFDGTTLRARFAAERPGLFAVQVVADVAEGPRPVLEARVFADTDADAERRSEPVAPRDDLDQTPGLDDAGRLAHWLAAARASAGLPALRRDSRLDGLARAHAARMASTRLLAHDAGDGSPTDRVRSIGLDPVVTGENVARASSIALAHRSLWESPSHRANILGRSFDRVGVGAVDGENGETWAVELFTGGR